MSKQKSPPPRRSSVQVISSKQVARPGDMNPDNKRAVRADTKEVVGAVFKKIAGDVYIAQIYHPLQAPTGIYLSVDQFAPSPLIENRPGRAYFSIWNHTSEQVSGFIRAVIQPKHSIDSYPGLFNFEIDKLAPGQYVFGAISFTAPRADLGNKLFLQFVVILPAPVGGEFETEEVRAQKEVLFDVGARFGVGISSIYIRNTASHHEDTLVAVLNGSSASATSSRTAYLGNHNSASGRSGFDPHLIPIGPFDVLPGESTGVSYFYMVANAGHTSDEETAKKVLETMSDVGAAITTVVFAVLFPPLAAGSAGLSAAVDALHHSILDYALEDCDTVVVYEHPYLNADDLFNYTFDPTDQQIEFNPISLVVRTQKQAGTKLFDWLGGGCNDSDYTVALKLFRYRISEVIHTAGQDGIRLGPGQETSFGVASIEPHTIVKFEWEREDASMDLQGNYRAPVTSSEWKYDVITCSMYIDRGFGVELVSTDFTIVLLD